MILQNGSLLLLSTAHNFLTRGKVSKNKKNLEWRNYISQKYNASSFCMNLSSRIFPPTPHASSFRIIQPAFIYTSLSGPLVMHLLKDASDETGGDSAAANISL
jgi:hypothetical protein